MVLVWLAGLGASALASNVRINEVLYDPTGSDAGLEWIELCNSGSTDEDITGWTVQTAGTSWSTSYTFTAGTVPAGGFLLVGAGSTSHAITFNPNLPNGGSDTDGIRLVDASSATVDTLLYDTPNTNALVDDSGALGTSFAVDVSSPNSLARLTDCGDTNSSAADFSEVTTPTPGATNESGGGVDTGDTGDTGTSPTCEDPGVVVNELLPDPAGSDTNMEWVELYNRGTAAADLSGWALEFGTASFGTSVLLPEGTTLAPGDFLLVGESGVAGADVVVDLNLGNAGSSGDGLRLVDCAGVTVDTVVYGPDNSDNFVDDSGSIATSVAPTPGGGETICRKPDGEDTDACAVDFEVCTASPDATNGGGGGGGEDPVCVDQLSIRINELMPSPEGSDDDAEWIELFNRGETDVDLSGWALQWGTSSFGSTDRYDLPEGTILLAGDYLLLGGPLVADADLVVTGLDMGNAGSSGDALRLIDCAGEPVDTVIYGPNNTDGWVDDLGAIATSVAPEPGDGLSLGRLPNGFDSDDCGVDFVLFDPDSATGPTPDSENGVEVEPEPCLSGGQNDIRINELLPNPEGSDEGLEYVELFNRGSAAIDLSGWAVQYGTSSFSGEALLAPGTTLGPGEFLVVSEVSLGNASSNADGVRLVDCAGDTVDTVVYGAPNDDGLVDDSGAAASSTAPEPVEGEAISRCGDGVDTDASGDDFVSTAQSPGAANPECVPVVCVAGATTVKINELYPNPTGTDEDQEFVELYNAGSAPISLDGWTLQVATSEWGDLYTFPGGTTLSAGAFLLVGGGMTETPYQWESASPIGNASAAPDGVRLVDCEGTTQDTVLYGGASDIPEDALQDDAGTVTMAILADEGLTIARSEDGVDSDDNSQDFCTNAEPSPGDANTCAVTAEGDGGGGGLDKGCGGEGPEKGCAVTPARGSILSLLGALLLLRRRRR